MVKSPDINSVYESYLSSLLDGDYTTCSGIVEQLLAADIEIQRLYEELFQRSLYQVGSMWEQNKISVATEHLATSTTESLLTLVYPLIFSREHIDRRVLVSCVANEFHQLGGRMVADVFELHRWHAYFLGANTPVEDMVQMIREKNPDLLALSVSISTNIANAVRLIQSMREKGIQLPVLLGGQAFTKAQFKPESHINARVLNNLSELDEFIVNFR